jgi:hypothetical protein
LDHQAKEIIRKNEEKEEKDWAKLLQRQERQYAAMDAQDAKISMTL